VEPGPTGPLIPELRDAEITLEHALTEACASPPASAADTGELIHVEEMLQVASEAAKRAISIRRRRRAEKSRRTATSAMGDAEARASAAHAHRAFVDVRGVWWDVFAVYPEARGSVSQLKGTWQQGWLCFDSGAEKRRLSPIPDEWQRLADDELLRLLERADVASSRRGRRPRKDSRPDDRSPSE
jgi:hypothetical protein